MLSPEQKQVVGERARQLFRFLKAYAERRMSLKRTLDEHEWTLRLRSLPNHPAIVIGNVLLNAGAEDPGEGNRNEALLTVRRPRLTDAPKPPEVLADWIEKGWQHPQGELRVKAERHATREGETVVEPFDADPQRVAALAGYRPRWEAWAEAERPVRDAMRVFERLFQLYSRIRLESERVELMLGDGLLRWRRGAEQIDHPVLLQHVQLEFDPDIPELRLSDADRAPELYTALLDTAEGISPQQLTHLRQDLEQRGYHPLEQDATDGFLTRVVQQLSPRGEFRVKAEDRPIGEEPVIERDPVLFLRQRVLGFSAAFDHVLEELEADDPDIPLALVRLVGIEPPPPPEPIEVLHSPWGEPPDVLLSKPANNEQIAIARALERHRAIQVQGPPGTGKSHTIANLIGHLVAHGKRVLVTSHTTKALRVLRQHIVEPLRPLAVSVLENDLEGRTQMKEAVTQILSHLTESSDQLAGEVETLASTRAALNAAIDEVTTQLAQARAAEYLPIVLAGASHAPAEAARWVLGNQAGNDWIPPAIAPGAPLPLTAAEVTELYVTNAQLSVDEVAELEGGLPSAGVVPAAPAFATLVAQARDHAEGEGRRFWAAEPTEDQIEPVAHLERVLAQMTQERTRLVNWEAAVVRAGHSGGTDAALWQELAEQIRAAHTLWDQTKRHVLEHAPELPAGAQPAELTAIYEEIHVFLAQGGSLGWLTLLTRTPWKAAISGARVDELAPTAAQHFAALKAQAQLQASRQRLKSRWKRQAVPAGFPDFGSLPGEPESALLDYAARIESRLKTWNTWWSALDEALKSTGLQWQQVRDESVAATGPVNGFERDTDLVAARLPPLIDRRLSACRAMRAERLLKDISGRLGKFQGPVVSAVRTALDARDPADYARAMPRLEALRLKLPTHERRSALLAKLRPAAPVWAEAIQQRRDVHGGSNVPGDPVPAWKWRQFHEELRRRAELDEIALGRKLEHLRVDLRQTTARLIERMAWKEQVARVGLRGRQALRGWADTQAKIGKGTGKRAPELQAQARRLLEEARDAVPVWIMPLTRVAESFQSSSQRFDVVIVDEASQSDVLGLLAWYLGDKLLVVGDDEQVSPLDVGQDVAATAALISQHLQGIPNAHLYDGKTSIYNLAGQSFGGTIRLREHFRCMPAIIEFSNHLSYNGEIRPLRNPASVAPPHVIEHVVSPAFGGRRDGKRNEAEARMVVALLKAMAEHPFYAGKTFGAISLLGDEQAGLIQELAVKLLGAVELEALRFGAGSPAQFQGDERDVVLLSMVDVPSGAPLRMRQEPQFKQRFNVAASRARDQMWLVHSLDPERDLKEHDLRRELILHFRDPEARARKQRETLARAESPFEEEVIRRLLAAGYEVEPQVWVGNYRIDLVVGSGPDRVAVECDGDRFHGVDQMPADMARQAILERAGWRFVRIRGTRFFRDPDQTMEWVCFELSRLRVTPSGQPHSGGVPESSTLQQSIERRAWEILREQEWLPAAEEDESAVA